MSWLKYVLFLILLFGIGAFLLGALNPGVKIEDDTTLYESKGGAWDAYLDTAKWHRWRMPYDKLIWKEGLRFQEGAHWELTSKTEGKAVEIINQWIGDSLLGIQTVRGPFIVDRQITFEIDNGKTRVTQEEQWSVDGLWENIKLNFNQSTLQKQLEIQLDSLQQIFTRKPSEHQH